MQMKTHVEILRYDKVKYHADQFIKNFIDKIHSGKSVQSKKLSEVTVMKKYFRQQIAFLIFIVFSSRNI